MKSLLPIAAFAALACFTVPTAAQEGCKATNASCSGMYKSCQQICAKAANPARCEAASCEINITQCRATGVWNSRGGSNACWKTNNRG